MDHEDSKNPDASALQQEVRELEDEGCRAFIARDLERLDRLWSDDLLVNSPINRVHGKRRVLELLEAGTIAHSSLRSHVELIQRFGDIVVVMGNDEVTNSPDGPVIRRRFTNLWRAEGGSWRLLVRHANVICEPAGIH